MSSSAPQQIKLGLCLSGGGFRASLFHIGALAALAEKEILHQVEVLSTVSGGSIIGAYYYLKIKQLLEGRRPGTPPISIRPEVYLDIVSEIERDFLAAVQKNPRMRLLLNPWKNSRMMTDEGYSRSDRMSEILNELFFRPISLQDNIHLNEIHIIPPVQVATSFMKGARFDVRAFNKAQEFKIPILTINATCLNTGHPWHFTGSWVGEPERKKDSSGKPNYADEENTNAVLPQLRFDGTYQNDCSRNLEDWQKQTLRTLTLADAVAASAAVPGIFAPLAIHNLYKNSSGDEIVVELSDGGVFDNQGIDALLAADCTEIFVSDACGQLMDQRMLGTDVFTVATRANDVMMERIRGWNFYDLAKTRPSPLIHLRQQASNTSDFPALPDPINKPGGLVYRLSGLRTDLDSFTDIEAYSLMYHAYGLARDRLGITSAPLRDWNFLKIRNAIRTNLPLLEKHFKVGSNLAFKAFHLAPARAWSRLAALILLLVVIPVGYLIWRCGVSCEQYFSLSWWREFKPLANVTTQEIAILALVVLPLFPGVREIFKTPGLARRIKLLPPVRAASQAIRVVLFLAAIVTAIAAWLHLRVFDCLFLKAGKLNDLVVHKEKNCG